MPQCDGVLEFLFAVLLKLGVVFPGGVHITVSKNIGDKVDVPGFLIEVGSVGTPKLMWGYMLTRYGGGVLLYKKLHSAYRNPAALGG